MVRKQVRILRQPKGCNGMGRTLLSGSNPGLLLHSPEAEEAEAPGSYPDESEFESRLGDHVIRYRPQ